MTNLVIGATGKIGGRVAGLLAECGIAVRVLAGKRPHRTHSAKLRSRSAITPVARA